MQFSTTRFPNTESVRRNAGVPWSVCIQPLVKDHVAHAPASSCSASAVPRCRSCSGYYCKFCKWQQDDSSVEAKASWRCCLCGHHNNDNACETGVPQRSAAAAFCAEHEFVQLEASSLASHGHEEGQQLCEDSAHGVVFLACHDGSEFSTHMISVALANAISLLRPATKFGILLVIGNKLSVLNLDKSVAVDASGQHSVVNSQVGRTVFSLPIHAPPAFYRRTLLHSMTTAGAVEPKLVAHFVAQVANANSSTVDQSRECTCNGSGGRCWRNCIARRRRWLPDVLHCAIDILQPQGGLAASTPARVVLIATAGPMARSSTECSCYQQEEENTTTTDEDQKWNEVSTSASQCSVVVDCFVAPGRYPGAREASALEMIAAASGGIFKSYATPVSYSPFSTEPVAASKFPRFVDVSTAEGIEQQFFSDFKKHIDELDSFVSGTLEIFTGPGGGTLYGVAAQRSYGQKMHLTDSNATDSSKAPASWRVPSCNPSSCLWLDLEFNPRKGASSIAAAGHHKLTSVEAATSIAPSDDDWDTRIPVAYLQFAFSFIARSAKTGKMSRWLRICTRRVVVGLTTLDVVAGVRRDACFGMLAHKVISDFRQARSLRPVAASDLQCRNLDFSGWMVAARPLRQWLYQFKGLGLAAMEVDIQTGRSRKGTRRCAASRRRDEVERSAEEFVHAFSTAFGATVNDNDSIVLEQRDDTNRTGRNQKKSPGVPGARGAPGFFRSNASYSWFLNALSSVRGMAPPHVVSIFLPRLYELNSEGPMPVPACGKYAPILPASPLKVTRSALVLSSSPVFMILCGNVVYLREADTVTFSSKSAGGSARGETTRQRLQSFLVTQSLESGSLRVHTELSEFGRWLFDHLKKADIGYRGAVFVLAADTGDIPLKLSHLLALDRGGGVSQFRTTAAAEARRCAKQLRPPPPRIYA